jgi:hypothetical protein
MKETPRESMAPEFAVPTPENVMPYDIAKRNDGVIMVRNAGNTEWFPLTECVYAYQASLNRRRFG